MLIVLQRAAGQTLMRALRSPDRMSSGVLILPRLISARIWSTTFSAVRGPKSAACNCALVRAGAPGCNACQCWYKLAVLRRCIYLWSLQNKEECRTYNEGLFKLFQGVLTAFQGPVGNELLHPLQVLSHTWVSGLHR